MFIPSPDVITYSQRDFSVQLRAVTLQSLKACNPSAVPGGITAMRGNVSSKNFLKTLKEMVLILLFTIFFTPFSAHMQPINSQRTIRSLAGRLNI